MRLLLILAVLAVIGLIVTGAITLQRSNNDTITIQIDKGRVKEDAERVIDKGREVLKDAGAALRDATKDTRSR